MISKYIGETEKNLSNLFDKAQNKGWILFFDEGDALFGKRSDKVESANDLHANQQISYLLQRIETFDGLVILSTNVKKNIDAAFMRRFDIVVPFYKPGGQALIEVWKNVFPPGFILDESIDWETIATFPQYAFSPGEITNIMKEITLRLVAQGEKTITYECLLEGIRKELTKKEMPFVQPATKTLPILEETEKGTMDMEVKKTSLSPANFKREDLIYVSESDLNERIQWMVLHDKIMYNDKIQMIVQELVRRREASSQQSFKNPLAGDSLEEKVRDHFASQTEKMKQHIETMKNL